MRPVTVCLILLISTTTNLVVAEDQSAPNGTIYGHVYDAQTKQPISGAWVYSQGTECSKQLTDSDGYYAIENCFSPSSTYNIECTKNSYVTDKIISKTDYCGKADVDFYLELEKLNNNSVEQSRREVQDSRSTVNVTKQIIIGSTNITKDIKDVIYGYITNAANGAPIPHAKIYIMDSKGYIYSGMADINGFYMSNPIISPLSAYDVICDTFGYIPNHNNVITDASGNAIANIAVQKDFDVTPETCRNCGGNWQNGECIFGH